MHSLKIEDRSLTMAFSKAGLHHGLDVLVVRVWNVAFVKRALEGSLEHTLVHLAVIGAQS